MLAFSGKTSSGYQKEFLIKKIGQPNQKILMSANRTASYEGGGSNPEWGAQDFQYRLSSAETQQPVDRMRRKARGCLALSVLF